MFLTRKKMAGVARKVFKIFEINDTEISKVVFKCKH